MKKTLSVLAITAAMALSAQAAILYTDTFAYPDGTLVGNNGWKVAGTTATPTVNVASGTISLAASGQDVGTSLLASVNTGSIYAGFDLSLSAAQAGDYFFAFNTSGTATNYNTRVFAKSSGSGFVLGIQLGATNATPTYSSTVMDYGTAYRIVIRHDFVSGSLNDTGIFYINPADTSIESNNTAAVSLVSWSGSTNEDASLGAVSVRQGNAANSATITLIDNLAVGSAFSDAAVIPTSTTVVPEPSTLAGIALGSTFLLARRRRTLKA